MRTLLLSLAGTVILALAGALPAGAQDASAEPPTSAEPATAFVSGTGLCRFVAPGTQTRVEGVRRDQGGFACDWETDDPRVSGPGEGTWNIACWDGNRICIYWGEMTISGPDGTWVGAYEGQDATTLEDLGHGAVALQQVLGGTGAYEGWTYVAHLLFNYSTMDVDGIIYEGPPMPWEPLPLESPSPAIE